MRFLVFISGTLLASLTCNSQNNDYEKITADTDTPTGEFKSIFSDESESLYDLIQCELRTKLENSQLAAKKSKIVPKKQSVNELATIFEVSKGICNDANSNSTDDEKLEKRSRKLSLNKVELYENGEENKLRCEHEDDEKQKMDDTVIIDNKATDTDNKLDNRLTSQIEQSEDQPISPDSTDRLHNQKQIKKIRKPNIIISPQSRKILNNDRRSVDDDFTDSDDSATWFKDGEPTPRPVIKTQFHFDLQSIKDPQIRDMPIAKYKKRTLISRFRNINAPRLPNPKKNILNACNNIVRYSRNKLNRMVRKFRRPTIEPKRQFTAKKITKDDIVYILNIEPETTENAAASSVITSSNKKQGTRKCVDIYNEKDESEQHIENNK